MKQALPAIILMAISLACHAAEYTQTVDKVKQLYLRTDIIVGGKPAAVVVPPTDERYQGVVDYLQERVEGLAGVKLPVKQPDEVDDDDRAGVNIIALGSVPDNAFVSDLYGKQFIRDLWRPGDTKLAVRTVHNPWGTGRNVVFIGAENPETLRVAVDVFLSHLETQEGSVAVPGFLMAFEPGRGIPELSEGAMASYRKRADEYIEFDNGRGMISLAASVAQLYASTGTAGYAEAFKLFMDKHAQLKGPGAGTHMNLWNAIVAWDCIEESPLFTDEERVRFVNLFLYLLRSNEGTNYSFFQSGIRYGGVRHNHQTLPGLDAFFGGRYLKTWGLDEEGDDYIEMARKLFVTQSQYHKPMCDCNQYEWTTLYQTGHWARAAGDMTIFDNGMYRMAADRAMMEIDNLGWGVCSGDCWTAEDFALRTLRDAAAEYGDGRYEWMINKHYGKDQAGVADLTRGVEPEEPTDILGIAVAPMDKGFHKMHETQSEPEPNLPIEQCFDKMSFRRSFDPEEEYMAIDGIGMGSHGHQDTNCIIRMTDNSRIWLVDMSYAEGPNHRDHNAVTVMRNGLGSRVPPVAGLDAVADLPTFGISETSVPDYNGLDWHRHIFWKKGEYFLVVDELEALQDGDYNTRCYWRSLGNPVVDGNTLTVTQASAGSDGPVGVLEMPDTSQGKVAKFNTKSGSLKWTPELAAGDWELRLAGRGYTTGDDSFFVHLDGTQIGNLYLSNEKLATSAFPLKIESAGKHEIMLTLREAPGCIVDRLELVPAGGGAAVSIEAEECEFDQGAPPRQDRMVIQWTGVQKTSMVRDTDNFGKWWKNYRYADPVVNIFQQVARGPMKTGEVRTIANLIYVTNDAEKRNYALRGYEGAWTVTDADGEATLFALHPGGKLGPVEADAEALIVQRDRIIARDYSHIRHAAYSPEDDPASGTSVEFNSQTGGYELIHRITPTAGNDTDTPLALRQERAQGNAPVSGDMFSPDLRELTSALRPLPASAAASAAGGDVRQLERRWQAALPGPVLSIHAADLDADGKQEIITGCADSKVRLLDDSGTVLWEFAAGGKINSVCSADVDGDGKQEIIAGSDDRKCYCLNRDGTELWSFEGAASDNPYWARYWKAGEVEKVIAADIDGDGKDEVVFGAANMNLHALDHDGKLLWRFTRYGVITSLTADDMTGDGVPEVIGGPSRITCTSEVSILDATGKRIGVNGNDGWASALTAVATARFGGAGDPVVLCGTNFNNVYALSNDKGALSRKWQFTLGDMVTALCAVDFEGDGNELAVAGSASEYAYCFDADGKLMWSAPLGAPVIKMLAAPVADGEAQNALAITEDGLYVLDGKGNMTAAAAGLSSPTDLSVNGNVYVSTADGQVLSLEL